MNTHEEQVQALRDIATAIENLAKAFREFAKEEKNKVINVVFEDSLKEDNKDA